MRYEIFNSKGEAVSLTKAEQFVAHNLQRHYDNMIKPTLPGFEKRNALGYEIDITSLTQLIKSVTEQKFHEVKFADYVPVVVGEGAWSSQLVKYRSFDAADDFETGILNTGASNAKLASVDSAVEPVYTQVINWAKEISYSIIDLKQASLSGNWDLVSSKEKARWRNWNLGLQQIAFWGSETVSGVSGLLTQAAVNINTTLITQNISDMDAAEFQALLGGLIEAYRANGQRTAMPTHFIIPESDFNGLASSVDETYPLKSRLERLLESFRLITNNPNFKILPNAYGSQSQNANVAGLNKNRYVLLNFDDDTIRMDIPVQYTNTMQNTLNGFTFQNVGYGQYSGVQTYRPLEVLYFDWAAS
jgi:hypothetical protein